MAGSSSTDAADNRGANRRNFLLRLLSALVLAPLAVGVAWVDTWPFAAFWGIAAVGVWWEWTAIIAASAARTLRLGGTGVLALALALTASGRYVAAFVVILLGAAASNVIAPAGRGLWTGMGLLYAASLVMTPLILRHDPQWGFTAIIFIFAVVWATDILAYLVGRAVGGPKLWPRVSPNKTWSGAIAGITGGIIVGAAFSLNLYGGGTLYLTLVGLMLSIVSQCGDLFESAMKRRFGAKDASHIIPGHGGLMDRLDGFIAAALAAVIYGGLRAGLDGSAQGLLQSFP